MQEVKEGKTILVTGATSGFGKMAVQQLLERGHRVLAGVRGGQARLEALFAEELRAHGSDRLLAVDLHMERPETFAAAVKLIDARFDGKLDVLVNNAGYVLIGPFETQGLTDVQKQFDVNFFGPAELTRAVLPALRRAKGRVLNVSSAVGLSSMPFWGTYAASKHALEAHTEGLYYDLKPFGVQVGLIEPGSFRTDIVNARVVGAGARDPQSVYFRTLQNFEKWLGDNISLAGNPKRVARLIVRRSEQRRVPIRSVIGVDAWLLAFSRRFLPERLRVATLEWAFRKFVLRPNATS